MTEAVRAPPGIGLGHDRLIFWGDPNPFPRKRWLVPNFIAEGEIVGLVGDPFAGKSLFATTLAASIASDGHFYGRQVATGTVVYVAAERARATWARLGLLGDNLRLALWRGPVRLAEKGDVNDLLNGIRVAAARFNNPVRMVVIDTLSRCAAGIEENSARDTTIIIEALQRIADAGPAVLVLHHLAKGDARSVRGSSVLTGGFDGVVKILTRGDRRTAKLIETNDGEPGGLFEFEIDGIDDDRCMSVARLVPILPKQRLEGPRAAQPLFDAINIPARQLAILRHVDEAGGRIPRSALSQKLRDEDELSSNPASASELLRLALKAMRGRGEVDFDAKAIWRTG